MLNIVIVNKTKKNIHIECYEGSQYRFYDYEWINTYFHETYFDFACKDFKTGTVNIILPRLNTNYIEKK